MHCPRCAQKRIMGCMSFLCKCVHQLVALLRDQEIKQFVGIWEKREVGTA